MYPKTNIMKRLILLLFCLGITGLGYSQHYLKSAGFRLGHTPGITYQKFVERTQAVELMVSGRHGGVQFNTLYKWHTPARFDFDDKFVLYYGVGGHFGFERFFNFNLEFNQPYPEYNLRRQSFFTMGVDVIFGIEYRMLVAPLTIGFDIKPYINYIGFQSLDGRFWDSAITIKYVFND